MPNGLPDWYTPETPEAFPLGDSRNSPAAVMVSPGAKPSATPAWYTPEPEGVTVTADRPESLGAQVGDLAANVGTGIARIPGAIIGTPHMLVHTGDWLWAKLRNMADGGDRTGADVDQDNPLAQHTLSSDEVDKGVFKGISAVAGQDVKPYEPTSFVGKLLQAGVTGAGAGLLDPLALMGAVKGGAAGAEALRGATAGMGGRMAKTALAADAASATQQAFPDSPGLAAVAALAAHTAAGAGATAATKAYRTFAEPVVQPRKAGEALAGSALAPVDNTQPGMAAPTKADIAHAEGATRSAVDDIGSGVDDYTAGGNIRGALQGRQDALKAARSAAADQAYAAFREQQPLEGAKLSAFSTRPGFQAAVKGAAGSVLDEGGKPLTGFWDFNPAGDPILRPNAAVPTDVLDRIKGQLDDAVSKAQPGSRAQRTATILRDQFVGLLDKEYPDTYPKTRADFAAASRPLDPLSEGIPGKVLDSSTSFGRRTYTMPQDKITGAFLQSKALKTDYDGLIAAYGGDKAAALDNLEHNLASKVQGAVNGDGTLSLDAFNRAVRPHTSALKMWFPQLAQKFATAEGAQKSLERLRAQDSLVDDVAQGALRGSDDFVTRSSAERWIDRNAKRLEATQSKAAVMRLRQIAQALPDNPGGGAQAAVEAAPMVVGGALGGLEGGVLGGITHNIPAYLAAPRMAAFRTQYSRAIEKAFTDPVEAQRLVTAAAKRGGKQSLWRVLSDETKKAVLATPAAVLSGTPVAPQ